MKINDNIFFWIGMSCGSGLVFGDEDIVVVDAQMRRDQANLMVELMRLHGLNPKNVRYIINTHRDPDHIGGTAWLQKLTGAKIVAHSEDAKFIENPESAAGGSWHPLFSNRFRTARSGPFEPCKVEVKVSEDTILEADDFTLTILHTPGHTPGSICVYHESSKVLFSGCTVMGHGRPYKVPRIRMDMKTMLRSLEKLKRLEVGWLLPGHGDVVQNGNRKINESIKELVALPEKILKMLREKPYTLLEVSEELLIWPQTIEITFKDLEQDGKIQKIEREGTSISTSWAAI